MGGGGEAFLVLKAPSKIMLGLAHCSKDVKYSLSRWNPGACAHNDTTSHGAPLALFVVNSVKLQLTSTCLNLNNGCVSK